jgi:Holliday junction resolvasome RuvABC ATP-dependent DNA helicase subunit
MIAAFAPSPARLLALIAAVALLVVAGGLAATGGFGALSDPARLVSLISALGAGGAFAYVGATLLAARGSPPPPPAVVLGPIEFEDDSTPQVTPAEEIAAALATLESMVGLASVKSEVASLMARQQLERRRKEQGLPVAPVSLHMIFTGPPGVGKTEVARLIGRIYKALGVLEKGHVVETARADLVDNVIGGTAIKTMKVCERALDGILLIDEAYALSASTLGNDFGKEAIETLMKFMEDHRDRIIVIAAGYPQEMDAFLDSNPGLKSRFAKTVDFPPYAAEELSEILRRMAAGQKFELPENVGALLASWLAGHMTEKGWANARSMRNLFERMREAQALRAAADASADLSVIEPADVSRATGDAVS